VGSDSVRARITLVLFAGAPWVSRGERNRGLGRAFEKAAGRKPLVICSACNGVLVQLRAAFLESDHKILRRRRLHQIQNDECLADGDPSQQQRES
jgi:hypothetical protein